MGLCVSWEMDMQPLDQVNRRPTSVAIRWPFSRVGHNIFNTGSSPIFGQDGHIDVKGRWWKCLRGDTSLGPGCLNGLSALVSEELSAVGPPCGLDSRWKSV